MERICWANAGGPDGAEFVVVGVPDESGSHAARKGAAMAPAAIRAASNGRDAYVRGGRRSLGRPVRGTEKRVHDMGDIGRGAIAEVIGGLAAAGRVPVMVGGDHSITRHAIDAVAAKLGRVPLVYFDAHPDMVSSETGYHGSVVHDALPSIDAAASVQVGVRTPEQEELDNLAAAGIRVVTPADVRARGLERAADDVVSGLGGAAPYVSFDLDCVDPAHAPGVSVPVPGGLSSAEAAYLLGRVAGGGLAGLDVVEACPPFDPDGRTAHLASRLIAEAIYSHGAKDGSV